MLTAGNCRLTRRAGGWALRAYLGVLLMLFVVVAAFALGFGWVGARRDAVSDARADARFGARKAAEQVGRNFTAVRASVDVVATSPGATELFRDPGSCRLSFSLGGADDGHLDVLRRDGTVVCSSRPLARNEVVAYRHASWLTAASGTPRLIGPVPDDRTSRQSVLVAAPVGDLGMVAAFVDLAGLGAAVGDTFGGARSLEFLLVSGDGRTILTRCPAAARWAGAAVRDSRFTADETGAGSDVTGLRRVYGVSTVPGSGWRLYAGADRSAALAGAQRLAVRQGTVAALGLAAGLLATLLVYRRITRPIGRLRTAMQDATADGVRRSPVTVTGPREVSDLAVGFAGLLEAVDRELTERSRAEQVARELERNYRQMFDTSPYPIYLFDADTLEVVAANDAAVQYFGQSRDALLRTHVTELCPADDAPDVQAAIAAAGPVERCRPQRHRKNDGTVTEVEITSHVTTFAGRTVRCAVIDDVSERQHLQRRLRQSERLESLGQLAGGIAHDFNNLLGIINGYAAMSAADVADTAGQDPAWARLHDDLMQIVAAGDRAAGLTRQLLAFARADPVTELTAVDLNAVVADVETLLRRTLGEDITLATRLTEQSAPVLADVGRLEQVLVNLAVNARDAMPNGGTLTIDTDVLTVDEHYVSQHPEVSTGQYMRLRVSDTGTGMSRETLERAFEPFFTTKPKGRGTGLGLATIYGIITQAGGHAQIYSEPGHGTTVAALLPITSETAETAAPATETLPSGTGQTILLVEDDDALRALLERILQRSGYRVASAGTAADALAHAAENAPDLLLTDFVLPDMNGPELADALHPKLRAIYMSGYAESILAARGTLPAGATLLQKPVTAPHLLSVIARELQTDRATQLPAH
jgi:PAS domain S-box-containing protein